MNDDMALGDVLGSDALGRRTLKALHDKGIETVGDVRDMGISWILDWTRVGAKGVDRIVERLGLESSPQGAEQGVRVEGSDPESIRRMAKYQAGLILDSNLNHWEPDELIAKVGPEVFDQLVTEIADIASRLKRQGGGP